MSISCNDVIILAPTNALISIRGRPYDSVLEATRLPACAPLNFNAEAGTITIREGKSGKPHRVVRSHKGRTFFAELTAGAPGASSFSSTTMARHVSHRTSNARWTPRAPAPRWNPPRRSTSSGTPTPARWPRRAFRWASSPLTNCGKIVVRMVLRRQVDRWISNGIPCRRSAGGAASLFFACADATTVTRLL